MGDEVNPCRCRERRYAGCRIVLRPILLFVLLLLLLPILVLILVLLVLASARLIPLGSLFPIELVMILE